MTTVEILSAYIADSEELVEPFIEDVGSKEAERVLKRLKRLREEATEAIGNWENEAPPAKRPRKYSNESLLTVAEAAEQLGIPARSLRNHLYANKLTFYKYGARVIIEQKDLDEFKEKCRQIQASRSNTPSEESQ